MPLTEEVKKATPHLGRQPQAHTGHHGEGHGLITTWGEGSLLGHPAGSGNDRQVEGVENGVWGQLG